MSTRRRAEPRDVFRRRLKCIKGRQNALCEELETALRVFSRFRVRCRGFHGFYVPRRSVSRLQCMSDAQIRECVQQRVCKIIFLFRILKHFNKLRILIGIFEKRGRFQPKVFCVRYRSMRSRLAKATMTSCSRMTVCASGLCNRHRRHSML